MEQSCSNKIVSLHLKKCQLGCPNSKACYLRKREVLRKESPFPLGIRKILLQQGFKVYDAVCEPLRGWHIILLKLYPNYHVTISIQHVTDKMLRTLEEFKDQVQVSIYSCEDLKRFNGLKSFLVYDQESYEEARRMVQEFKATNLHFSIDRDWWTYKTSSIFFLQHEERKLSTDSCLTSWIINDECPYTKDYIDLSFDGTVRRCPFEKQGTLIPDNIIHNDNYIELFNIAPKYSECEYEKKLRKKPNG